MSQRFLVSHGYGEGEEVVKVPLRIGRQRREEAPAVLLPE